MALIDSEEVIECVKQAFGLSATARRKLIEKIDELDDHEVDARFHYVVSMSVLWQSPTTSAITALPERAIDYAPTAEDLKQLRENEIMALVKTKGPSASHSLKDVLVMNIERREGTIREAEIRKEVEEMYKLKFEKWKEEYIEEMNDDSGDIY